MGFRLKGQHIGDAVKNLTTLQGNQAALDYIRKATTSCAQLGGILQELMQKDSIQTLFLRGHESFNLRQIGQIGVELRGGKAVLVSLKLPDSGRHIFCIESRGGCDARILHGWQDVHDVRAERTMPIGEMIDYLKRLWRFEWVADRKELENVFGQLFGADHAQLNLNGAPVRQRVSFETVLSGMPERPLDELGCRQRLSSIFSGMSNFLSPRPSRLSGMSDQAAHPPGSQPVPGKAGMIGPGAAVGAALGFVFGVGGVLWSGESNTKEVILTGTKSASSGAASGGVAAGAANVLTPTFARSGSAVSGVAFLSVFAVWDVAEWRIHKITEVQLRLRMAEGLGAAGGIGGGAVAGLGFGLCFGPIGAVVGGIVGGVAGGIGGAFAGKAIDGASEDSVMNMYEFFGWHNVRRNTRPVKTAEEMEKAYNKKLESRPLKIKEKDWDQICQASVVVLLQAMYPVFKEVMKMAATLQKNKSEGVSAIGTAMYQPIMEEELVSSRTVG